MEFIKAEEARELMETGLRNELERIQEKIIKAATNNESYIYWTPETNTYKIKIFLKELEYTVDQHVNNDLDDYFKISWT